MLYSSIPWQDFSYCETPTRTKTEYFYLLQLFPCVTFITWLYLCIYYLYHSWYFYFHISFNIAQKLCLIFTRLCYVNWPFPSFWCCVFIVLIVKMEAWREADNFLSHVSKRAFNRRAFFPWGCDLVLIVIEYPSTLAANCSCLCSNIPLFSSENLLVVEVGVEVVLLLQLLEQATVDQLLSPSDDNSWRLQTGEKLRQEILTTANEPALIVF